jgi:integrase
MARLEVPAVYVALAKASVVTGARQGELIAANLDDLDLLNGTLRIERHYDSISGEMTRPKDNESRTLFLIPPARTLLEEWVALTGNRDGSAPLFEAPSGGRCNGVFVTKLIRRAMDGAKPPIPRAGSDGGNRKPFHALRSCYGRLLRERGLNPEFVQGQFGHSDPRLTLNTYGRWSDAAKKAEAERVEAAGSPSTFRGTVAGGRACPPAWPRNLVGAGAPYHRVRSF